DDLAERISDSRRNCGKRRACLSEASSRASAISRAITYARRFRVRTRNAFAPVHQAGNQAENQLGSRSNQNVEVIKIL
ncbi:MAG: hypothetical protein FWB75_05930, partial [Oscillospiraceae bacterium]|nr:hypothetical protein [Oscillospiraceae bacterium]